jgi:hypothetical protein
MVNPNTPWHNPPYRPPQPEPWPKKGNWHKWFAWYPVKVDGNTKWFTFVYRRKWIELYRGRDEFKSEYGTIFDILKD